MVVRKQSTREHEHEILQRLNLEAELPPFTAGNSNTVISPEAIDKVRGRAGHEQEKDVRTWPGPALLNSLCNTENNAKNKQTWRPTATIAGFGFRNGVQQQARTFGRQSITLLKEAGNRRCEAAVTTLIYVSEHAAPSSERYTSFFRLGCWRSPDICID